MIDPTCILCLYGVTLSHKCIIYACQPLQPLSPPPTPGGLLQSHASNIQPGSETHVGLGFRNVGPWGATAGRDPPDDGSHGDSVPGSFESVGHLFTKLDDRFL